MCKPSYSKNEEWPQNNAENQMDNAFIIKALLKCGRINNDPTMQYLTFTDIHGRPLVSFYISILIYWFDLQHSGQVQSVC